MNISDEKITAGGSKADNMTAVTWNDQGTRGIFVNDENANGFAANSGGSLATTVLSTPLTQNLSRISNN